VVGQVGPQTHGVQRMLERIGFRYVERVDPFDGGPHFECRTSEVTLLRKYRTARVAPEDLALEVAEDMLVSVERESGRNRFRAVRSQVRIDDQIVYLPAQAKELLGVSSGVKVSLIPFESG
jgi:arginine N-succinyltransferase